MSLEAHQLVCRDIEHIRGPSQAHSLTTVIMHAQASQSLPGRGDRGKIAAWRLIDGVGYSGVPTRRPSRESGRDTQTQAITVSDC